MTSPYVERAAKRAAETIVKYIERHEKERYEALGYEVRDCLGHHAAHALLAIRRPDDES